MIGKRLYDLAGAPQQLDAFAQSLKAIPKAGDTAQLASWRKCLGRNAFLFWSFHRVGCGAGDGGGEYAAHTWAFLPEFKSLLTNTEGHVLDSLGACGGSDPKQSKSAQERYRCVSRVMKKAQSTVRKQCNSIREKLYLDTMDQLFRFATLLHRGKRTN